MALFSKLVPALSTLVLEVGDFIRKERDRFSDEDIQMKRGQNDLVSYVDVTAEKMLTEGCKKLLPAAGFIREEGGDLDAGAEYRWIIDPLDGTTNFIYDIPAYGISLALQKNEETVLGIVYDIPRQEYFLAQKGLGASCNGKRITVSTRSDLKQSVVGTGFPYVKDDRFDDYLTVISKVLKNTRGLRRFGSAAIDLAWVACGRLDGFFEIGLNPWDVAAGELLIREAGGQASDFAGTDNHIFGKQIAGTNSAIHIGLLDLVKDSPRE